MPYLWESLPAMGSQRVFSAPVVMGESLYILGGCDIKGTPQAKSEVYDRFSKEWKSLADMNIQRAGTFAVASDDKKLLVFGGVTLRQVPVDAVEMFDIEANTWTQMESMPEKLLGLTGVLRGDKVLVVGGMGKDTNPKDHLLEFDPNKNRWKSYPSMPTPRYAAFSFLINDKLYVIGGRQGKVPVAAFEVFDFADNKWRRLTDVPSRRVFALYTQSDTHIYSIGGLNQNPQQGFSDACEVFDLATEKWKIGKAMPTKRGDFAIGVIDGKTVAAGGLGNEGTPLTAVEAYDHSTDKWTSLPPIPCPHCSCAYITFHDRLHVIGGLSKGGPTGAMEALGFSQ